LGELNLIPRFSSGLELITGKRILISLPRMYNSFYFRYLVEIFSASAPTDTIFRVVLPSQVNAFEKGFLNAFSVVRAQIARAIFVSYCRMKFPQVIFFKSNSRISKESNLKDRISSSTRSGQLPDMFPEYVYLGRSLHSAFCDLSGSSMSSTPVAAQKNKLRQLIEDFESNFLSISEELSKEKYDSVVFFNGRNPDQAGIREASECRSIAWLSMEHGSRPGQSFHFENFQTQDRISFQERVRDFRLKLSDKDIAEITTWSKSWLTKQRSSSSQNDFLRKGSTENRIKPIPMRPIVPIYTSSLDETLSETQWSTIDYEILVSRTVEVSVEIAKYSYTPIVIVHPNALKRSWGDLVFLVKSLGALGIECVLPWEQTSPYSFLQNAPFVVSWRSTISVEASADGLPSFLLADSIFDLVADVRILDFPLKDSNLSEWEVDPFGAYLYIYYFFNNGYSVTDSTNSLFSDGPLSRMEKLIPLGSKWLSIKKRLTLLKYFFYVEKSSPSEEGALLRALHRHSSVEGKLTKKLKRYCDQVK
jgi:hypothetical protein